MAITYTNWDCSNCNAPNRNDEHYCGSCGEKKPKNPNYYLPKNPEVVTDAEDLESATVDVCICGNCDMHNKVTRDFCLNCGHLMTHQLDNIHESTYIGASKEEVVADGELEIDTSKDERYDDRNMTYFHDEFESELVDNEEVEETKPKVFSLSGAKTRFTGLPKFNIPKINPKYILIALAVFFFIFFVYWLTTDTVIRVRTHQFEWHSKRNVEQLITFKENGWRNPSGSYDVTRNREIKNYRDSFTHDITEHYTVYEKVGEEEYQEPYPDKESCGTEKYSCGQEKCGNRINSNGFSEPTYCTKYCTRTKYCTVTKYRTKTRDIKDYVPKTREVPQYKSVPVFAIKYYYTIDRWTPIADKTSGGLDRQFKEVPYMKYTNSSDIRMSSAINTFHVTFKNVETKELYKKKFNQQKWNSFKTDSVYTVLTNKVGKFEFQSKKQ